MKKAGSGAGPSSPLSLRLLKLPETDLLQSERRKTMISERTVMKSESRRIATVAVGGIVFMSLLALGVFTNESQAGLSRAVKAQEAMGFRCTDATLSGRYALRGDGFVPGGPPPAPMVPFAVVSLMTLDGSGSLSNDVTVSTNGVISRNVDPGTYTVNEDCTGTMTINISEPPFQLNFDLVVADGGKEFDLIATTPSVVTIGAKRLR
jgi:hypothetical protein